MNGSFRVKTGLNIASGGTVSESGDLAVNSNKVDFHNGSTSSPIVTESHTATLTNKTYDAEGTGNTLSNITNTHIKAAAAIALNKLAATTVSRALVSDASGFVTAATTTSTEIGYVNGVTSAIQTQLNAKQTTTLANGTILVGNGSNVATAVTPTGDVTIDNSGVTAIGNTKVTNAMLAGSIAASKLVGTDIATVGTITSGTWSGTAVGATKGGTAQTTYTTGDMIYASATDTLSKLGVGSANQVIKSVNGIPAWATAPTAGINYINANPDAEVGTSGWATYADAAGNIPVNGTGGTATNLTFSRSTSSPLRGSGSFSMVQGGGSNIQGKGVSYDFTIDSADQAKPLQISFDYTASAEFVASNGTTAPLNDGTTSSNAGNSDIEVFIYDVTNSALIPVSPQVITGKGSSFFNFKGTFQTASNSTSYRLIFHVSVASADATGWTFKYDNVFVGPQIQSLGAPMGDWRNDLTFTASAGFGTVTGKDIWYRRLGDSMEVRGTWVNGTVAASTASIGLPSGLTIDYTKLKAAQVNLLGQGNGIRNSGTPGGDLSTLQIIADASTNTTVFASYQTASNTYLKFNGDALFATNGGFSFNFIVPITGWASTVALSNDTDTRIVAASYYLSANFVAVADTTINFDSKSFDTHNAVTTGVGAWKFTAPVSGTYSVSSVNWSTSGTTNGSIYKNGTRYRYIHAIGPTNPFSGSILVPMVAGDYIDFRSDGTPTLNGNASGAVGTLTIHRLSGPSTIAATETVSARYYASSTSITGSLATIVWTTKDWDTHGSVTSGVFTAPISGKYHVTSAIALSGTFVLNNTTVIEIQKNGTATHNLSRYLAAAVTNDGVDIEGHVNLLAGDTVRIQISNSGTTPAIVSSNTRNWFEITRVGN